MPETTLAALLTRIEILERHVERLERAAKITRRASIQRPLKPCRHYPEYPNCSCDEVACVMLRSPANPAGLEQ